MDAVHRRPQRLSGSGEVPTNIILRTARRALGVGLTWGIGWHAVGFTIGSVIGLVDPDSIDSGESPIVVGAIIGWMGLLSGIAFWFLASFADRGRTITELSSIRAAGWGTLGSAVAQLGFLGHGDLGLAANIQMALIFCAFGGAFAAAWVVLARRRQHRSSSLRSPS